jgi:hypothetical protein
VTTDVAAAYPRRSPLPSRLSRTRLARRFSDWGANALPGTRFPA